MNLIICFFLIIFGLEVAALGALAVYKCWTGLFRAPEEVPEKEVQRKQEELEKAWSDGMSAISGYDINVARRAVRNDGEG